MLKPEQAQARLSEWKLPPEDTRLAAAEKLPPPLGGIAELLISRSKFKGEKAYLHWQEERRLGREAALQLMQLSPAERIELFATIAPGLAPALDRGWQLLLTTPYQVGYVRKAYRAPNHPALMATLVCSWVQMMSQALESYQADVLNPAWLATWTAHLPYGGHVGGDFGVLLAAVINQRDAAGDEVFDVLRQSLTNDHEIAATGRHVYTAFLLSDREEGWELIEKTLLAAQRQEGLRQAILESIDLTHPTAFRRMLRLILEHDLFRFSAVVRALDVWFGQMWSTASTGAVKKLLEQTVEFLDNPAARGKALRGKDAAAAHLALWCAATEDAVASVPLAEKLLTAKSAEIRFAAASHLKNLDLDLATTALIPALDDENLQVVRLALFLGHYQSDEEEATPKTPTDRFERIERLIARVPAKPVKLEPIVWPWTETTLERTDVTGCLALALEGRPPTRLIPHLPQMSAPVRGHALRQIAEVKPWDAATREAMLTLAGDASPDVRSTAIENLAEEKLAAEDLMRLEGYLNRKAGDLRRGILDLLLKQSDAEALASAARLCAAKDASQRLAGVELLRLLADAQRSVEECRRQADAYKTLRKKLTKDEQAHFDALAQDKAVVATLDDALGLLNPADRSPAIPPRDLHAPFFTDAAIACLKSLDELVHEHRETSIKYDTYRGKQEELLGNVQWGFPGPRYDKPRDKEISRLPLAEVWTKWYAERGPKLRDADGFELLRALVWQELTTGYRAQAAAAWTEDSPPRKSAIQRIECGQSSVALRYARIVNELLEWFLYLHPFDAKGFLLDAQETAFALVPADDVAGLCDLTKMAQRYGFLHAVVESDWRDFHHFEIWSTILDQHLNLADAQLTADEQTRRWQLLRWRDEPLPGAARSRVAEQYLFAAYDAGAANLADVTDHLLAPRGFLGYSADRFGLLALLTSRNLSREDKSFLERHPEIRELKDRAVERILELELSRGDAPTAASAAAHSISSLPGIGTLHRLLHALGKGEFKVGNTWRGSDVIDRRQTLTSLVRKTYPAEHETPDDFVRIMKAAVRAGEFPEERLLQLTFLAPQWTKSIEAYFGWKHMAEGVYWFIAHMRYVWGMSDQLALAAGEEEPTGDDAEAAADSTSDDESTDDESARPQQRKLSAWERLILERTPLSDADRNEGAIDVEWFRRTYAQLGDKHWQALAAAARFAANAIQAKRAKFIAETLLGRTTRKELVDGIKKKQLKDYVRLLGLLPLAKGAKRDADLQERCRVLREYRRYANQLSGLTKPDALRAWDIGMKNLAQTAGFADPLRLEWAVGADAVKDLAKGPVSVTNAGVTVTLALDEFSKPEVTITKGDKPLKTIPPAVKKHKKVAELTGRVADLKKQASAIRQSLEAAMCRGDVFTGEELQSWCGHALVAPLLSRLVVVGDGIFGYPDKGGKALRDYADKLEPVKKNESLRIAHPHDLLESKHWQDWQHDCFRAERVQPFKQVFRELYVVTKQEKTDGGISHRYDGQQVQPRQALALFGQRGWNTQDGIFKVFHDLAMSAAVDFDAGFSTPLEVEGATIAGVMFRRRDEWKPMPLAEVPPRLFSEVMRDLDLVVSVAHAGGVDPEASASTVEMRESLVQETAQLLQLKNVRLKSTHALIDGELANYTVHLGSGVVHTLPGGAICLVPVHAQHRGRLFLPFADDDPKTAEVISKVLLLARDREIQDPVLLEQIRR